MPIEIIVGSISVLSVLVGAFANHLLTRRRTAAEAEKIKAEAEKIKAETAAEVERIKAETEKIKAETTKVFVEIGGVLDVQLTREVVFDKDNASSDQLYWIDDGGVGHLLPNHDTALVFASQKGFTGISQDLFERIAKGSPLPEVSKDSFRRIKHHYFLIVDGKAFWLSSLSPVFRYWDDPDDVPEISPGEFRKLEILR